MISRSFNRCSSTVRSVAQCPLTGALIALLILLLLITNPARAQAAPVDPEPARPAIVPRSVENGEQSQYPIPDCRTWATDPREFCFSWRRTETSARLTVELLGYNPYGRAEIGGIMGRPDSWSIVSVTGEGAWPELATWAVNYLNHNESGNFPLVGRNDLREPFERFLYFTRLHLTGEFYMGWSLESDAATNPPVTDYSVWAEGSFPNGGLWIARMPVSNGCYQWFVDTQYTSDHEPYPTVAKFISDYLNGWATEEQHAWAAMQIPAQYGELVNWLDGVQMQLQCTPHWEEPPVPGFTYTTFVPMAAR